MMDKVPKKTVS